MAFTQPCFIRKNTPELRKKLEELGYNRYPLWMADWSDDDSRYIYLVTDVLYYTYPQEPTKPKNGEHINCGTNEDLFLALSALRDDTPINSFYWFNRRLVKCEDKTEKHSFLNGFITILKCRCVDDPNICFGAEEDFLRKATVEEIIEHFKDR